MTRDWASANQAYLAAAIRDLRARVAGRTDGAGSDAKRLLDEARAALPSPASIDTIAEAFGLSGFERDVLLLCAAAELGEDAGPPTFALALATLPDAHWSALSPASPLRHWRLIEVLPGDSLVNSSLRIDERVLHALAGVHHLDPRLDAVLRPVGPAGPLAATHAALAERLADAWRDAACVELCGGDAGAAREIAAAAADAIGRSLWRIQAEDLPADAVERDALMRLWHREVVLSGGCLLIDAHDAGVAAERVRPFVGELRGRAALLVRQPIHTRGATVRLDVPVPPAAEQALLWQRLLEPVADVSRQIPDVAAQFRLGVDGVRAVARQLSASGAADEWALWNAARLQARRSLDDLATRIEPAASWDDLVLPAPQKDILRQIADSARRRTLVQEAWGVRDPSGRGLGISVLFAGASGTGKTMAAEVIARELRLDVYRIDLSQVVSKYIGETEKNLARVFDAAEQGGAVLLFDEADALFGRRTEVKDSHDRYANIEVSYLLQRMESYHGLAILTTNAKSAIDPAFLRRLRYVVQFPFPDPRSRQQIWTRILPEAMPREGLDPARLARLDITGGNIRNIAVNAAFLATAGAEPVRMTHLLRAARAEYAKLEKPLTDAETAGWT